MAINKKFKKNMIIAISAFTLIAATGVEADAGKSWRKFKKKLKETAAKVVKTVEKAAKDTKEELKRHEKRKEEVRQRELAREQEEVAAAAAAPSPVKKSKELFSGVFSLVEKLSSTSDRDERVGHLFQEGYLKLKPTIGMRDQEIGAKFFTLGEEVVTIFYREKRGLYKVDLMIGEQERQSQKMKIFIGILERASSATHLKMALLREDALKRARGDISEEEQIKNIQEAIRTSDERLTNMIFSPIDRNPGSLFHFNIGEGFRSFEVCVGIPEAHPFLSVTSFYDELLPANAANVVPNIPAVVVE